MAKPMSSVAGMGAQPSGGSLLARYSRQLRAAKTRVRADFSDLQGLEIKRLDALMRHIVEANFDAILIIDTRGRLTMANAAAAEIFGYSESFMKGLRAEQLVPGYKACSDPRSEHYCVGKGHRATLGVKGDGTGFPIDLCLTETRFGEDAVMIAIVRDVTELRRRERQLEHQALHDALTGLPNRVLLGDRLNHAVQAARRDNAYVALLMLDLDGFKDVNDTLGHHVGDMLLVELAKRLSGPVRDGDTVARLGGDEFAVLLPGAALQRARQIAERLGEVIVQPVTVVGDLRLEVGASIGIGIYPLHAQEPGKLMQCADVAMYAAKAGPAKVVSYDSAFDSSNIRQLRLSGELREAIEGRQLGLEFQPKLNLQNRGISQVEALARWNHPRLGRVSPEEFVVHAERSGLIIPLTRLIVEGVLDQMLVWQDEGLMLDVAINLSPRTLHDPAIPELLRSLIGDRAIASERLTLEITETAISLDPERAFANLNKIADIGVKLSIDDFGTGYSSLSYLQQLPLAELKIDRRFVTNMLNSESDVVIVRSTIDLAHNLGLHVVAEGVENRQHIDMLSRLECDYGQGYFIARAMPGAAFKNWALGSEWRLPNMGDDRDGDGLPILAPEPPARRLRLEKALKR
ncbi:MAG: hypothetical protein Tsb0016_11290 [Sphingomonadales bacterium]